MAANHAARALAARFAGTRRERAHRGDGGLYDDVVVGGVQRVRAVENLCDLRVMEAKIKSLLNRLRKLRYAQLGGYVLPEMRGKAELVQ